MSGPCTDCGGPDYQTLEARIAEVEAENKKAVYGCCEECRALSEAEAALVKRDRMLELALHDTLLVPGGSLGGMAFCPRCGAGMTRAQKRCVRCHWKPGEPALYGIADLRSRAEEGSGK